MRRFGKTLFNLAFLAVLAGAVTLAFVLPAGTGGKPGALNPGGRRRGGATADAAPSVLAVAARKTDVPVDLDSVGTVKALNSVTIRPQVDGQLIKIAFQEGQDVKTGDLLARIDPATYQAQLDQALAKKAQDEAQLENAKRDLERYIRLAQTSAGTAQQADTQRATVAQFTAQLKSDQASIDNTRIILGYTTIVAPIDGRTGIRNIDEGNLVRASDATGIVTITQVQPVAVVFNLPQQQLARVNAAMLASLAETGVERALLIGSLFHLHMRRAHRAKRNRASGWSMISVMACLIFSGYALYYLANENTHVIWSTVHWAIGLALPVLLVLHIYLGRRASTVL